MAFLIRPSSPANIALRMKKVWTSIVIGAIASTVHGSTIEDCLGYSASHVSHSANGLVADLTLIGSPCNIYGNDLKSLKLQVEYQGGELSLPT